MLLNIQIEHAISVCFVQTMNRKMFQNLQCACFWLFPTLAWTKILINNDYIDWKNMTECNSGKSLICEPFQQLFSFKLINLQFSTIFFKYFWLYLEQPNVKFGAIKWCHDNRKGFNNIKLLPVKYICIWNMLIEATSPNILYSNTM